MLAYRGSMPIRFDVSLTLLSVAIAIGFFWVSFRWLGKAPTPRRAAAFEARQHNEQRLPWRRLTGEYTSPESGTSYLLIYRIPYPELAAWHRDSLLWPLSALVISLLVISLFSLLLTLSFTRPLQRLRSAVHDLGQTTYQQTSLAQLATRRDEFGVLANDFNRMGARLQSLISSQRQLLRDVSHELRSPLARLRIALALAERADHAERRWLLPGACRRRALVQRLAGPGALAHRPPPGGDLEERGAARRLSPRTRRRTAPRPETG